MGKKKREKKKKENERIVFNKQGFLFSLGIIANWQTLTFSILLRESKLENMHIVY